MSSNGTQYDSTFSQSLSKSQLDEIISKMEDQFNQVTTVKDLQGIMEDAADNVSKIEDTLARQVVLKSKRHQGELSKIELSRTKLTNIIDTSNELTGLFSSANDLGTSLTYKIKFLDDEISNVEAVLSYVKDVQLLRNNINQASYAMEHKDWDVVAHCIHKIKKNIPSSLISGKFASVVIPSTYLPELPAVLLQKWTAELTGIFQEKFNTASRNRDVPELTKYFQLFPLIEQDKVGLDCYSKFICSIIKDTSKNLVNSIGNDDMYNSALYSNIVVQLFESISLMLSQHSPLIKKYYGETYDAPLWYVITKIQPEIDSQVGLITDTFYDNRRIDKVLQDVRVSKVSVLSNDRQDFDKNGNSRPENGFNNELVPLVQAGDLINEVSAILHHWVLYSRFITLKYVHNGKEDDLIAPQIIVDSGFSRKINSKLQPVFDTLSKFYFRRSLEKAISIEELPSLEPYLWSSSPLYPDHAPCSSVIEDFTLVFNNMIRNTIETGMFTMVKDFVEYGFEVAKHDFIEGFLGRKLAENSPRYNNTLSLFLNSTSNELSGTTSPAYSRSSTPALESNTAGMSFFKGASSAFGNVVGSSANVAANTSGVSLNNVKLVNFVLYLNTLALGQEYLTKIHENLKKNDMAYLKNSFPYSMEWKKVASIIESHFFEPFSALANKMINFNLVSFYNQSLKNKIVQIINDTLPDYNDTNYLIYSSGLINDTTIIFNFHNAWRQLMRPYQQTFHKSLVYSKLIRLLVVNIANLVERRLYQVLKRFKINELGSIKLEKDLSAFINEICQDDYELREKFVKVTQIVLLVGMDDEEYEISKQSIEDEDEMVASINWVLTPHERNQIRYFRI